MVLPVGFAAAADANLQLFGRDVGKEKAYACYARKYTKAHLASHPDQNVRDMMVFVDSHEDEEGAGRQYVLGMSVNFRQLKQPYSTYGGCSAGTDGKQALNCGIDCDGGTIGVRIKDRNSILLDIPNGARVSDDDNEEELSELPDGAKFGSDDKIFRLDRTDLSACLPLATDEETRAALRAAH
ncbi:hypothetical protein [Rhizobium herbae]|uniref:Uncharacterized protein n=1 Tax=Rhizobium herbae TaxID=508661 RepID=A0ABS4ERR8_9HYPH|nr:hypothetical protein [Rhizobium herbae]MBP1860650.1 hypothetical protein [Rhizobium herbae]